jgi:hypothetical protein
MHRGSRGNCGPAAQPDADRFAAVLRTGRRDALFIP